MNGYKHPKSGSPKLISITSPAYNNHYKLYMYNSLDISYLSEQLTSSNRKKEKRNIPQD